jgi:hypothetical protein
LLGVLFQCEGWKWETVERLEMHMWQADEADAWEGIWQFMDPRHSESS